MKFWFVFLIPGGYIENYVIDHLLCWRRMFDGEKHVPSFRVHCAESFVENDCYRKYVNYLSELRNFLMP